MITRILKDHWDSESTRMLKDSCGFSEFLRLIHNLQSS